MGDEILVKAINFHKNGNLDKAKSFYTQFLKENPKNIQALILLGSLNLQLGSFNQAIEVLKKAEGINPHDITLLMNLAVSYQNLHNYKNAIIYIEKVLEKNSSNADAFNNLGNIYKDMGIEDKSIDSFKNALKINPNNPVYRLNKSHSYIHFNRPKEAIVELEILLSNKEYFKSVRETLITIYDSLNDYPNLIKYSYELLNSNILNYQDIIKISEQLITVLLKVNDLNDLPNLIKNLKNEDYLKNFYTALYLFKKNKSNEAKNILENQIKSGTKKKEILNNLGQIYFHESNIKRAKELFEESIIDSPDFIQAKINLGLCYLSENNFTKGLKYFSCYEKINEYRIKYPPLGKKWQGQNENENTSIYLDQGLGDAVFFASLINKLLEFDNQFYFICDSRLVNIFKNSFDKQFIFLSKAEYLKQKINSKYYALSGYLAELFINSTKDLSDRAKYLKTKTQQIKSINEPIVGISWFSSNPIFGQNKSINLEALISKLKNKYQNFISLQYGDFNNQIKEIAQKFNVNFILHNNDNFNDIDQLIDLIDVCDEIYTIDNTTVHLSGALGKKTHLLLPYNHRVNCWYWNAQNNNQSLWYPSVKIHQASKRDSLDQIKL